MTRESTDGGLTLAFDLRALKRLENPRAVYRDAREWSTSVGVISDAPPELVQHHAGRRRLEHDFVAGNAGMEAGLDATRRCHETPRHVLVGATDDHRRATRGTDWEYQPVEEAAAAAGWVLVDTSAWRRAWRRVFGR